MLNTQANNRFSIFDATGLCKTAGCIVADRLDQISAAWERCDRFRTRSLSPWSFDPSHLSFTAAFASCIRARTAASPAKPSPSCWQPSQDIIYRAVYVLVGLDSDCVIGCCAADLIVGCCCGVVVVIDRNQPYGIRYVNVFDSLVEAHRACCTSAIWQVPDDVTMTSLGAGDVTSQQRAAYEVIV